MPATEIAAAPTATRAGHSPLVLWHLFSLDAPTVAALWTFTILRLAHLPAGILPLAIFLVTWLLYAADRILDAIPTAPASTAHLQPRHHFHHRHRRAFLAASVLALAALIPIALHLPRPIFSRASLLALCLISWLTLVHLTAARRLRLPKEFAVGLVFSAAVFLPAAALMPSLRPQLLLPALLLVALCTLNCLYIFAWEHSPTAAHTLGHPATRAALRLLTPLAIALTVLSLVLLPLHRQTAPLLACIALSSLLLLLLHRIHPRLAPTTLRALADLALTTPVLLLPWLILR